MEPVTVRTLDDNTAWVVNNLSDTVSIVNLTLGTLERTISIGDEPTDVVFANGKAFVAVSQEDAVKILDLSNLNLPPAPTVGESWQHERKPMSGGGGSRRGRGSRAFR